MKRRLLFLGPPGAGKGTQAKILCDVQGFLHLSTGDLLREEVSAQTDLGKEAAEIMNKGELVSDAIVLSIVQKRLNQHADQGWLLDGFPRNMEQAKSLTILLEKIFQPIESVILIDIKDEILIQRLLARGRKDDSEEVIRHRLEVYRQKTSPLIDHYKSQGLLEVIYGDNEISAVASQINEVLK